MVKNLPAKQETWVQSLGQEDPLEKGTHSSILAWKIPWTEEPYGLWSWGCKEPDTIEQLTLSLHLDNMNIKSFSSQLWVTKFSSIQFTSLQSLSRVRLCATPWIAAHQASLFITNSWSLLKLMSIESVMPSSHLILCRPLLLLPLIPPSIRVFSNKSTLRMRWPKYWSLSFSIIPSNCHVSVCSSVLCLVTTKIWSNGR